MEVKIGLAWMIPYICTPLLRASTHRWLQVSRSSWQNCLVHVIKTDKYCQQQLDIRILGR